MVQMLTKNFLPGVLFGWVPGGPVCRYSEHATQTSGELLLALLGAIKSRYRTFCIRFDNYAPADSALAAAFKTSLVQPLCKLNTGFSLHLDLGDSLDELCARMTAKHRYYVKKALSERLEWKAGTDDQSLQALFQLHAEMVRAKQLSWLRISPGEVSDLSRALGKNAVVFTGYAHDVPVTSCLILLFQRKAFYWMAATGSKGREMGASYAMVYRLLEYLHGQGVTQFDFGGIAPGSPSFEGVNHFKRGFGGRMVEHVGEWEWTNSAWLRWGVNLAIRSRRAWL
jgi:hypothetical protein